ncbi:MAG: ATP-binding protein [Chloroflexi bacterium HGW-Chloroflexi-10]|nr:MAG: ATP-binding protein [Chloroflexi bacterium HGW-Chloroflexi-10]
MLTHEQVMAALSHVQDPELGRDLVALNMIRDLKIKEDSIAFTLVLTIAACPLRHHMAEDARKQLLKLPGIQHVHIEFGAMTSEERKTTLGSVKPQLPKLNAMNRIGRVLSVMSGKGGVGKSSVTAMLAVELARRGEKVGILDADITGASMPKIFGLPGGGLRGGEQGMLPAITSLGIRVVSSNLMLMEEDAAVAWRGPMIAGMIQKFWDDVLWGKLDTLLIDLPPGTSDATITVMQSLPVKGVFLVTTPQQLSGLVVRKAANLLQRLDIPILGVIENMSYFRCPDTDKNHAIFGPSHAHEIAEHCNTSVVTRLPIDPQVTELCDQGRVEEVHLPEMEALASHLQVERESPGK